MAGLAGGLKMPLKKHAEPVGGGLLPMAVGQVLMHSLTRPHRGQAPSHIWLELLPLNPVFAWMSLRDTHVN
ncbi:hypothetical protein TU77_07365 [Pseudomonas synxantha]|nr:hypothetical protein TU77_07365 [Pseudomonas synxantha]